MTSAEFARCYGLLPEALLLIRADGSIVSANAAARELLANAHTGLEDRNLFEFVSEPHDKARRYLEMCASVRQFIPGALSLSGAGGAVLPCRAEGAAAQPASAAGPVLIVLRLRPKREATTAFLSLNDRITQLAKEVRARKRSEAALEEQRRWLHTTLSSIGDAVIATDDSGRIQFMNPVAESLTGCPAREAVGQPLENVFVIVSEVTRETAVNPVTRVLREGIPVGLANHTALIKRDGSEISIDDSAAPIRDGSGKIAGVVLVFRDITESKRSEEQLRRAQKLESLGILAGGIAHDFNNLLTGILGNATLALEVLAFGHEARPMIEQMAQAGERAAHLTRQMLAYSGKGRFVIERLDLSEAVRQIVALLKISLPKKADVRMDLAPDLPRLEADPGQIQQLIMNLVINAGEAIGDESAGLILITTGVERVHSPAVNRFFAAHPVEAGAYVLLEVRDTGCGMDEATKQKIFDPFFSTKFTGRGLGLPAVLGIVRGHKGFIDVESAPGRGTTFRVLLRAAEDAQGPSQSSSPADTRQVILVIDDEEIVRDMARATLERRGFRVLGASNGREGLEVLRSGDHAISLVVLDMTMPIMSGEEALQKIDGRIPVIVSSGYSETEVLQRFAGLGFAAFLQKPFTAASLTQAVTTVLARISLAPAS